MGGSGLQGRGQEEKEGSSEALAVVRVSGGDHCEQGVGGSRLCVEGLSAGCQV